MVTRMIEQYSFSGDDFKVLMQFEDWKIGFLRYSERFSQFRQMERHMKTDEAFVLLSGEAVLYTEDEHIQMQMNTVYNIPKGEWHYITVSRDATVMVVENSNTCMDNTERRKNKKNAC